MRVMAFTSSLRLRGHDKGSSLTACSPIYYPSVPRRYVKRGISSANAFAKTAWLCRVRCMKST